MTSDSQQDTSDTSRKDSRLFWAGVYVGLSLTAVGLVVLYFRYKFGITESRLVLCAGLGILFGAFGSTATLKYKGAVIAGVAAIAIALLYVVATLTNTQPTFGKITGNIKGADIAVEGDKVYPGTMGRTAYDFVVLENELKRPAFNVFVTFRALTPDAEDEEIPFRNIKKKYIEKFLGSGKHIEWSFDRVRG
jgi:hypothetical protein